MKTWLGLLGMAALGVPAQAARADEGAPAEAGTTEPRAERFPRLDASLRAGVAVGFGNVYGTGAYRTSAGFTSLDPLSVSSGAKVGVPLILDLGIRVFPHLFLGAYGQWAAVVTKNNDERGPCYTGWSCSTNDFRLGFEVNWHVRPRSLVDPWLGVGVGYEWLRTDDKGTGLPTPAGALAPVPVSSELDITDRGPELMVQGGLDLRIARDAWIGPWGSFIVAQYEHHGTLDSPAAPAAAGGPFVGTPIPSTDSGGSLDQHVDKALHFILDLGIRGRFSL